MKIVMLTFALGLVAMPAQAQYDPYGYGTSLNGIARSLQRQQRQQDYVDDVTSAIRSQRPPTSSVPFGSNNAYQGGYGTYGTYNGGQPCYNRCR